MAATAKSSSASSAPRGPISPSPIGPSAVRATGSTTCGQGRRPVGSLPQVLTYMSWFRLQGTPQTPTRDSRSSAATHADVSLNSATKQHMKAGSRISCCILCAQEHSTAKILNPVYLGQAAQAGDGVEADQLLPQGGLLLGRRLERGRCRHRRRQHQHRVPSQQVVHMRA